MARSKFNLPLAIGHLYNAPVWLNTLRVRFVRWSFHHFYNTFAWTYDLVSAAVSLGHWREWTRAAIPHVRGAHVLEVAFGTGNLQLDMRAAGITPYGLDLSPNMARMTRNKLQRARFEPRLVRGSVFTLPLASSSLDTLVLTFPPGFLTMPHAVAEMKRVLADNGRVIVVDAGWLHRPALLSALINLAFRFTGTTNFSLDRLQLLRTAGFAVQIIEVGDDRSVVQVLIADRIPLTKIEFYSEEANSDAN
jgi:ubiquinone/menaquinone biosynthesis C-methylase UbiE